MTLAAPPPSPPLTGASLGPDELGGRLVPRNGWARRAKTAFLDWCCEVGAGCGGLADSNVLWYWA